MTYFTTRYKNFIAGKVKTVNVNNTKVIKSSDNNIHEIQLHGNIIAIVSHDSIQFTDAGWPTRTTTDRLCDIFHALGLPYSVCRRQHQLWVLNNVTQLYAPMEYGQLYTIGKGADIMI